MNTDDEPNISFYRTYTPRAKKEHVCDLCKKPILVGVVYSRHVWLEDGKIQQSKRHLFGSCIIDAHMDVIERESNNAISL